MTPAVVVTLALDCANFALLLSVSWGLHALRCAFDRLRAADEARAVDAFGRPLLPGKWTP